MANISKIKTLDGTVYTINDDNAVHKTGDEDVAGVKTHTDNLVIRDKALRMAVTHTDGSGTVSTNSVIQAATSNSNLGINVKLGANSNTIVSAGESGATLLTELAGSTTENLYLIADSKIVLLTNANTYSNAKRFELDANGDLSGIHDLKLVGDVVFNETATLDGVETTRNCHLTMNDSSLNFGLYDVTNSKWILRSEPDGSVILNGSAAKLTTPRSLKTKLDSTAVVTFDGSAAQDAIPVTGILPIANGGTGSDTQNFIGISGNQTGITGNKTWKGHHMGPIVENTDGTSKLGFRTVSHGGGVYDLINENWLLYREAATGYFSIQAKEPDATSSIHLRGYGDGRLTWDDSIVPQRHCRVGQSGTISDNKVWFKVAKLSVGDMAYSDYGIVFYVEDTQDSLPSRNIGILDVHWKNNGSIKKSTVRATWLYSHQVTFSDYVIAYDDTGSTPIVELWTRVNVGYQVRRFAVLNEFGFRAYIHTNEWDLINNYGVGEIAIPSNFTQIQSTPASYWKDTAISNVTLGSATTATSSSKYITSISGIYKELYVRLYHSTAQPTAATCRYRFVFSDGSSIMGQSGNVIATNANNYATIHVVNDDGLLKQAVFRGYGNPASGAWYSHAGTENEYMPNFASPDAYITSFELWSTSTSVTQLPANFQIKIWGKNNV